MSSFSSVNDVIIYHNWTYCLVWLISDFTTQENWKNIMQYVVSFQLLQNSKSSSKSLFKIFSGKDWGQREKGVTEDELVGWHHWLSGHDFELTPGDSEGQGSLACCNPWGHKELGMTERLNNNFHKEVAVDWSESLRDLVLNVNQS